MVYRASVELDSQNILPYGLAVALRARLSFNDVVEPLVRMQGKKNDQ
jgi:hypothetical protein